MRINLMCTEKQFAVASLILSCVVTMALVLVATDDFVLQNFVRLWGPQAMAVLITMMFYPRPAVVSGVALILLTYFVLFFVWASRIRQDGMVWIFYYFSIPSEIIGAMLAVFVQYLKPMKSSIVVGMLTAAIVSAIMCISLLIACSNVLYCGF